MHDPRSRPDSGIEQAQSGFEPRCFNPFMSRHEIVECLIQEIQEGAYLRPAQILKEFGKDALKAVPAFEQLLCSRYMDDFAHDQMSFAVDHSNRHEDIVKALHPSELFAEVLLSIANVDQQAILLALSRLLGSDNHYNTRAAAYVLAKRPELINFCEAELVQCLCRLESQDTFNNHQETTLWYLSRAIPGFANQNNYLFELIFQLSSKENLSPEIGQNFYGALSRWAKHSGSFIFDSLQVRLRSDSFEMQVTALRIIAELGPDAESLVEEVQALLSHKDSRIQLLAVEAFGSMGALRFYGADPGTAAAYAQAIAKLKNFTDEPHSLDLRKAALLALGYLAEPATELRQFFKERLRQYNPDSLEARNHSAAKELYAAALEGLMILKDMYRDASLTTCNS